MALYTDGTCIRAVARFFQVSHVTIQRWIRKLGKMSPNPLPVYTPVIEIDELCSYVKSKKKRRWLWVAVCRKSRKILAFQLGSRGKKTLLKLYYKISSIKTDMYCTDKYVVYRNVLPKEKHLTILGGTNIIEGINASIRRYLSRFHRRSVCYNKSEYMLYLSMNLLMNKFNQVKNIADIITRQISYQVCK